MCLYADKLISQSLFKLYLYSLCVCVRACMRARARAFLFLSFLPRLKVRGHNLVWSMDQYVQDWIKQLSDADLRNVVRQHIEETMNKTRGL